MVAGQDELPEQPQVALDFRSAALSERASVRLYRVAEGRRTTLARGQARLDAAIPADSPIPLFLVCGRGDEAAGPHVVFTVVARMSATHL